MSDAPQNIEREDDAGGADAESASSSPTTPPPSSSTSPSARVHIATMHCLDCGYALDGLTEHRCPECGRVFDPADQTTWRPWWEVDVSGKPRRRHRILTLAALLVVTIALLLALLGGPSAFLLNLAIGGAAFIVVWFLLFVVHFDARRWTQMYDQREAMLGDMRFGDLAAMHRRLLASWRPAPIYWWLFTPGLLEHTYAGDLYRMHRLGAALQWAQRAVERMRRRAPYRDNALHLRAMVLIKLGRTDDERVLALLDEGEREGKHTDLRAWFALNEGRVDEAAALAVAGMRNAAPSDADGLRLSGAVALMTAGRFDQALSLLEGPATDALALFAPKQREQASRTKQGRGRIEQARRSYAAMITRRMHLAAARVHMELGNASAMRRHLDAAEVAADRTPELMLHLALLSAGCAAMEGDAAETNRQLSAGRTVADRLKSRIAQFIWHAMAGECRLLLGDATAAREQFEQALTLAVHPIERHEMRYRLARACEAAGDVAETRQLDQAVVADGFATRWSRDAAARLAAEA